MKPAKWQFIRGLRLRRTPTDNNSTDNNMFAQHSGRTLILCSYYAAIIFFSRSVSSFSSLITPTRFCCNRPHTPTYHEHRHQTLSQLANSNSNAPSSNEIDTALLESIKSMRVKELKSELQSLNVSIRDGKYAVGNFFCSLDMFSNTLIAPHS